MQGKKANPALPFWDLGMGMESTIHGSRMWQKKDETMTVVVTMQKIYTLTCLNGCSQVADIYCNSTQDARIQDAWIIWMKNVNET